MKRNEKDKWMNVLIFCLKNVFSFKLYAGVCFFWMKEVFKIIKS
jgi:hypothetical protein